MRGKQLLIAGILAAGCGESSAEPPLVVRIEAATATLVMGTVGTEVTPAPVVRALSEDGAPAAGVAITLKVKGGGGWIANTAVKTNEDGLAAAGKWILGPATGNQTLTASSAGAADVVFTAIAEAGPPALITAAGGNDQIASGRERLPRPLRAKLTDAFGNPIVGAEVTFTVLTGDGRIENGVAVSGQDGIAESGSWTLGPAAGIQQVKAESGRAQMIFLAHAYVPPSGLQGKLAFVSASDGNADIYVADADGLRRLTTNSSDEGDPAWSPDGSQIAFVVGETHIDYPLLLLGGSIYVMAADGSNVTQRTRGPRDRDPAWHPGGSAIAFSAFDNRSTQIATVDKAGETVFLTDDAGQEFEPSWSPDGRRLAFVTDWQFYDFVHDIHTMNADGTLQTRQTDSWALWPTLLLDYLHPVWSPDGSKIAFVYGRLIGGGDLLSSAVVFTVAVMSADGVFIKDLASAGDIPYREVLDPGSLTWSPDGRGIAYTSIGGCEPSSEICRRMHSVNYVSLDGSQQFRIVSNAHSPSWHR